MPDSVNIYYQHNKYLIDKLNLENIENGVDSLELRIRFEDELFIGGDYLLLIKIDKEKTKGYIYRYWLNSYPLAIKNPSVLDSFKVKDVIPKSGWSNFFEQIKKEKIYELPSADKIPNFKYRHTDGYTWNVEIATKNSYRFYYYGSPEIYAKEFEQCAQMIKIGNILKREFDFIK